MELNDLAYEFVTELEDYTYTLSSLDHVWNLLFPSPGAHWHHLHVNKYNRTFFITHITGGIDGCGSLEVEPKKHVQVMESMGASSYPLESHHRFASDWKSLFESARKWLKIVRNDWIKANKRKELEYPLDYRFGIAPNSLIRASISGIYRLDTGLGKVKTRKLVSLVEDGYFRQTENTEISSMTADHYFQYCKIGYLAGKSKGETVDCSLTGREMYDRYADGRHEGLLDIDPSSEQEFADWIDGTHPKRDRGGHPWEIQRGGNTTHVDLSVSRPSPYQKEGFKIELRGASIGRMVEVMRMFLAIQEAGLPISIADPEGVRKRLLAQDNIGIIPSYASLHRANQHFNRDEDVFDVMHYHELGRYKRRITPFITWEPLPILKPMGV